MTADVPGIGVTNIFSSIQRLIRILPGSEIDGVPASDINDIVLFSFKIPIILSKFFFH